MSKERFDSLASQAKDADIKVRLVGDNVLKDYAAMNWMVARSIGFKIPDREIWVSKSLDWDRRLKDLRHELYEADLMLDGYSYWDAHLRALEMEKRRIEVDGDRNKKGKHSLTVKFKRRKSKRITTSLGTSRGR